MRKPCLAYHKPRSLSPCLFDFVILSLFSDFGLFCSNLSWLSCFVELVKYFIYFMNDFVTSFTSLKVYLKWGFLKLFLRFFYIMYIHMDITQALNGKNLQIVLQ